MIDNQILQPLGFKTFALEFHLPFYAWRQSEGVIRDERPKRNGKPLRRSRELTFLEMALPIEPVSDLRDCIYEVQISGLVTGVDNWSWTAYTFVDTYYKGLDNSESVESYVDRQMDGYGPDPLTAGRYPNDRPVWRPREYFLRVFESRVDQVKQEWYNTVSTLLQQTEPYVC